MRLSFLSLALLAAISLPTRAHADTLTIYVSGVEFGSSVLPATLYQSVDSEYFAYDATFTLGSESASQFVIFYNPSFVASSDSPNADLQVGNALLDGPQLYSGPESAPTLLPGDYTLTYDADQGTFAGQPVEVVISAATPEPSSLVLLGTGILALGGAARQRFRA
jgi:hypothetical protein